jgi:predicted S18 family serine protease
MYDYWHMHREKKNWKTNMVIFLLVVIALFTGITIGSLFSPRTTIVYNSTVTEPDDALYMRPIIYDKLAGSGASFAAVTIPAVDRDGNGITTRMFVQALPGSGRVLTNIDRLLFWVDTQNSIRRATQVAENVTGINLTEYDIIYAIEANASVIGGPSAGAAITIATIAALQNVSINESVMITGSVNHDGSVGPVGNVMEKAVASKEAGAELFLVPMTQSSEVTYKTREYCEKIGWVDFCTTETYPVKVNIEEDAGIDVEEVMDIEDVMEYMLI